MGIKATRYEVTCDRIGCGRVENVQASEVRRMEVHGETYAFCTTCQQELRGWFVPLEGRPTSQPFPDLSPGDRVRIAKYDERDVLYTPAMGNSVGQEGTVTQVDADWTAKVKVKGAVKSWGWRISDLEKLPEEGDSTGAGSTKLRLTLTQRHLLRIFSEDDGFSLSSIEVAERAARSVSHTRRQLRKLKDMGLVQAEQYPLRLLWSLTDAGRGQLGQ